MAKKVNIKNTKKIDSKNISNENEMLRFIKMIIIVTLIFLAFYVLTIFINKEDKETDTNNDNTTVSIQYDEILIGNIFNQNTEDYYVLVEDTEDIQVQVYEAYLNIYKQKEEAKRVYTAKMNNMFNSKYIGEESNLSNSISDFKVSGTTLLEISNGKITNSYETEEKILEILKEISKTEEKED